jgi:hypothetical protein
MSRKRTYLKESRVLYNTRRSSGSDMGSISDGEVAMSPVTVVVERRRLGSRDDLGGTAMSTRKFPAKRPRRLY